MLVLDKKLLAADTDWPDEHQLKVEYVQQELLGLILESDQYDYEALGRAVWMAVRAAETITDLKEVEQVREIVQIYLEKIDHCLHEEYVLANLDKSLNRLITDLIIDLEIHAITDPLTGLNNRGYFDKRLQQEVTRIERYQHEAFTLVLFDIDHFKKFNDQYGHQTGDDVLKVVAKLAKDSRRVNDIAARYGGEEFCLILPSTTLQGGILVAEQLRKSIEEFPFVVEICQEGQIEQSKVSIHISLGVAEYQSGTTPETLLKAADDALYRAKEKGRNRTKAATVHA